MPFLPNIGPGELILILIIALVVLGPGKLPDVAQSLGKSLREFRKAASDVQDAARVDAPAAQAQPPAQPTPAPTTLESNTLAGAAEPNTLTTGAGNGDPVAAGTSSAPDSNAS